MWILAFKNWKINTLSSKIMRTEKAKSSHFDSTRGYKNQKFPTLECPPDKLWVSPECPLSFPQVFSFHRVFLDCPLTVPLSVLWWSPDCPLSVPLVSPIWSNVYQISKHSPKSQEHFQTNNIFWTTTTWYFVPKIEKKKCSDDREKQQSIRILKV